MTDFVLPNSQPGFDRGGLAGTSILFLVGYHLQKHQDPIGGAPRPGHLSFCVRSLRCVFVWGAWNTCELSEPQGSCDSLRALEVHYRLPFPTTQREVPLSSPPSPQEVPFFHGGLLDP